MAPRQESALRQGAPVGRPADFKMGAPLLTVASVYIIDVSFLKSKKKHPYLVCFLYVCRWHPELPKMFKESHFLRQHEARQPCSHSVLGLVPRGAAGGGRMKGKEQMGGESV